MLTHTSQEIIVTRNFRVNGRHTDLMRRPQTVSVSPGDRPDATSWDVTIATRGLVLDGSQAGQVTRAQIEGSPVSAPCFAKVCWGAHRASHSIIVSVKSAAVVSLPPSASGAVDILTSNDIMPSEAGIAPDANQEWRWQGEPDSLIFANIVEVTWAQACPRSMRMEQSLSVNLEVLRGPGAPRPFVTIPPSALTVDYTPAPRVPNSADLDVNYPTLSAPDNPPFYIFSIQSPFAIGAPVPTNRISLVDRMAEAIACHAYNQADTRALIVFTIQN